MTENERNFAKFKAQLQALSADLDESAKRVVSQMANVGLAVTKENTPTGDYKSYVSFITKTGKKVEFKRKVTPIGGTLKKSWKRLAVHCTKNGYSAGYFTNVLYALYVNNGHRVVNKEGVTVGYVVGKRMLEQGINEARRQTETLFNQEIARVKRKGGW